MTCPARFDDFHCHLAAAHLGDHEGMTPGAKAAWDDTITTPQTSAAHGAHSPRPADAAETPPAERSPHFGEDRRGHLNVEDIVDEYWDAAR